MKTNKEQSLFGVQLLILCVFKCQAEKKLKAQLTSLEQQHSKTREALKDKEDEVGKQRELLKTMQKSLEDEVKKLKGQVTQLQEAGVKKVSNFR